MKNTPRCSVAHGMTLAAMFPSHPAGMGFAYFSQIFVGSHPIVKIQKLSGYPVNIPVFYKNRIICARDTLKILFFLPLLYLISFLVHNVSSEDLKTYRTHECTVILGATNHKMYEILTKNLWWDFFFENTRPSPIPSHFTVGCDGVFMGYAKYPILLFNAAHFQCDLRSDFKY